MPPRSQAGGPRLAFTGPQGSSAGPQIRSHVTTIGVRRTAWGTAGRGTNVNTNHFEVKIPQGVIHHYDIIAPAEKNLPARLNLEIIKQLQNSNTQIFQPKAVYDGRKNMFAIRALPLQGTDAKGQQYEDFKVGLTSPGSTNVKEYKVRVTKVAEINPELLHGFLQGRQSHDSAVLTAITALNVVIRMEPISKYPFNVRSFFTDREQKDIGGGIVLWRGYFQSIRPGGNRMWINIDISTGTMYKEGPLISLCLSHLGYSQPENLASMGDRDRVRLQRFLSGVRIYTIHTPGQTLRVVKKISAQGASQITFNTRDQGSMTVANYFRNTYRRNLQYPLLPCVEVGSGALIPLELCVLPPGQIMRKQVPPEKTRDVLQFSTQKPGDRLASIRSGLSVFEYDRSEYLRSFGMSVNTAAGPQNIPARVLQPPTLVYGGTKQKTVRPDNGVWNMRDKKFYAPGNVHAGWIMIIFERQGRFNQGQAQSVIESIINAARDVGIRGVNDSPYVTYCNPQAPIRQQLMSAGMEFKTKLGGGTQFPGLMVAVLPEMATDVYTAIKHFGDCVAGVPTQCLKASKCGRGNAQYFANVCLKLNVKLGGINCIPLSQDVPALTDPTNPALIFGADVIHPAPGADGRPSFTALVGNVDPENSKYVARCAVQESRVEIIQDLKPMAQSILSMFSSYHARVHGRPTLPLAGSDGVSEGQFKTVLDEEVPQLRAACAEVGLAGPSAPKLTVIIVGKRHHVRFFPSSTNRQDMDNSGNCRAGTVVDREISHPLESDYYLQSHAGLLGTSRPAHYNVLLDENNFSPDALQQLSFALCHVYARSTRSVSIPAPVYYADIVCSRAKNHFDPQGSLELDPNNTDQTVDILAYKKAFKPVHQNTSVTMYFS
ncbi:hypothetical protein Clacol_001828 [Clathrus columnatus]|uniref:Uncharacterized protein n=1 Tax=Clathrus columnatus TaxID=1419009 RepID=A0AAV5A2Y3_9AGAM|nr:hypothetical protein Clacol_001828 [Clathrus columnatus]